MEEILENLDQPIISLSKNEINYCNKLGLKIFHDLKNINNELYDDEIKNFDEKDTKLVSLIINKKFFKHTPSENEK